MVRNLDIIKTIKDRFSCWREIFESKLNSTDSIACRRRAHLEPYNYNRELLQEHELILRKLEAYRISRVDDSRWWAEFFKCHPKSVLHNTFTKVIFTGMGRPNIVLSFPKKRRTHFDNYRWFGYLLDISGKFLLLFLLGHGNAWREILVKRDSSLRIVSTWNQPQNKSSRLPD